MQLVVLPRYRWRRLLYYPIVFCNYRTLAQWNNRKGERFRKGEIVIISIFETKLRMHWNCNIKPLPNVSIMNKIMINTLLVNYKYKYKNKIETKNCLPLLDSWYTRTFSHSVTICFYCTIQQYNNYTVRPTKKCIFLS